MDTLYKSIGIIASRPNITSNGVKPIVSWTLLLYANHNCVTPRSQFFWFLVAITLIIFFNCSSDFSLWSSHWGCPGVVSILSTSSIAQMSSISFELNSFPLPLRILSGIQNIQCSKITFATVEVSLYVVGQHTKYLLNESLIIIRYLSSRTVAVNGPA